MADWTVQKYFEDVKVDDELDSFSLLLTPQRMIMAAGAVRDFNTIHIIPEAAKAIGSKDMFMNNGFIMMTFFRLMQEFAGLDGKVVQLGPIRIAANSCANDTITYGGKVAEVFENEQGACVKLAVYSRNQDGENTCIGEGTIMLPHKA